MNDTTRTRRPTTSTPRKNPPGKLIFQSTRYAWMKMLDGTTKFTKIASGVTFRRS